MVGEMDPLALSERLADLYLRPDEKPPAPAPTAAQLLAYEGRYWNAQTFAYLKVDALAGGLAVDGGDGPQPLTYLGAGVFRGGNSTTRYVFQDKANPLSVRRIDDDSDPVVLTRLPAAAPATASAEYEGVYYSEDLGVAWTLRVKDSHLVRAQWLFPAQPLTPVLPDTFVGDLSEGTYALKFDRDASGRIEGFEVGTVMVRPLRFLRCEPAPRDAGPLGFACRGAPR